MFRMDLEPTVTLATSHSIVEVISPEKKKYQVESRLENLSFGFISFELKQIRKFLW